MATKEYDLNELIGGTVDSIVEKFGDLSDEHLTQLGALEGKAPNKRSTLLKAIESEQGSRKLTARTAELQELAGKDGIKLHSDADVEGLAAQRADEIGKERDEQAAALKARNDELERAAADRAEADRQRDDDAAAQAAERAEADKKRDDEAAALAARVGELETQLRAANSARKPAKAKAAAKPRRLVLDTSAPASDDGGFAVAFTGPDDVTLQGLPELEFDRGAFEPIAKNGGLVLKQPIEFPEGGTRAEVCKVWLLDGERPVAVSRLVSPLPVGGGGSSRIPEGYLRFDVPRAPAEAAAE